LFAEKKYEAEELETLKLRKEMKKKGSWE